MKSDFQFVYFFIFQGIRKKMTCSEFIENLAELNDGENFNKDILKCIYHAIKTDQIEWAV